MFLLSSFFLVRVLFCVNLSIPLQGADVRGLIQTGQTQRERGHGEGAETQTTPLLLTRLIVVERFVPFCRRTTHLVLTRLGKENHAFGKRGGCERGEGFRGHGGKHGVNAAFGLVFEVAC